MEEGTQNDPETVDIGRVGGDRISVKHQQRILGPEGPLSKFETTPSHILYTLHRTVDSNIHTHLLLLVEVASLSQHTLLMCYTVVNPHLIFHFMLPLYFYNCYYWDTQLMHRTYMVPFKFNQSGCKVNNRSNIKLSYTNLTFFRKNKVISPCVYW